jgi:hypothetical protein
MSNNMVDKNVSDKVVWENGVTPDNDSCQTMSQLHSSFQPASQPQMMFCYKCNNVIPSNSNYCPYCQVKLFTECPKCGVKYSSQYPSCSQCGTNRLEYLQVQKRERVMHSCKNEINGHEYVDLGLPSGLKWATCNVGATSPEQPGGRYGWGNDNPDCTYEGHSHYPCNNPPQNISGTQFDVARKIMGIPWRMPTKKEFQELKDCCSLELGVINNTKGYFFISRKNANKIFLPFCTTTNAYKGRRITAGSKDMASYWTANRPSFIFEDSGDSTDFNINMDGRYYGRCYFWDNPRDCGYTIRAVCN